MRAGAGARCACVVALLGHALAIAGEGATATAPASSRVPPTPPPEDSNELPHVTFPPLDAMFPPPEKQFATENNTVVTSQTGSTALLPCVIRNIGDGIVSWIRRKDYHLLTVGLTTYSSDQRFQAIHLQHSEDWTLKVRFVQKRDAGIYECQVSSHPPTSIFLRLDVVEARAQISGDKEKFLKPGSELRLQCTVVHTTEAPAFVFWYHNSRMINYDFSAGINVTTDAARRISLLLIPAAGYSHAGNYTCVPNNAVPASIQVHVFNGENPAAMQSSSPPLQPLHPAALLLTLVTLVTMATLRR